MKKNLVLFVLFVLPIVAYLFFASGINSFSKLPTVTAKVPDFPASWKALDGKPVSLDKKITVLGFGGKKVLENRGNIFNLNQKIYQRYHEFKDLQFVTICPEGTQQDVQAIVKAIGAISDTRHWSFVFAKEDEINAYFQTLKLKGKLNDDLGTDHVYIIDKERNLRGRKDPKEYKEGYSTFHPSELSNEMLDDFKIILYEYRAALKKNNSYLRNQKRNVEE
ncbi:MAG: hypothetical protein CFE23_00480 [Flavobacterium sp. BFFFF1]|uniref:hypothetical protein n=1 Tax=Flavobacterium sp. BFFFF1 TaxID=2015557 RepID=UPI000BC5C55D|nr:hypothetical protein [Flavobacterium sp. BFFFF1]OYU82228.1 MAG: hypothetical protein CFE23_00480 [Flavobacterium sp. BFFFF1]